MCLIWWVEVCLPGQLLAKDCVVGLLIYLGLFDVVVVVVWLCLLFVVYCCDLLLG